MDTAELPKPLTRQQAIDHLSISERTMVKLVKNKEIKHYRVGKKIFFLPEHITDFQAARERKARA